MLGSAQALPASPHLQEDEGQRGDQAAAQMAAVLTGQQQLGRRRPHPGTLLLSKQPQAASCQILPLLATEGPTKPVWQFV